MQPSAGRKLAGCAAILAALSACSSSSGLGSVGGLAEFKVAADSAYTVRPLSNPRFDKGFAVKYDETRFPVVGSDDHQCVVGFKNAPQNADLTQAQINAVATAPEREETIRAIIGIAFDIQSYETVTIQGYQGSRLGISPKSGPGSEGVGGQMTIVETPRGRMTKICLTEQQELEVARSAFSALDSRISLPE